MATGALTKDPQDVIHRGLDWATFLTAFGAVTIVSSVWTGDVDIALHDLGITGAKTTVKISGGTSGHAYNVRNHIVLSDGQEYNRSLQVVVSDQ